MPGETDGVEEAFEGTLRVAVTAAARIGEQLARAREQYLIRARAQGEQAARDYAARLEAERAAARAELAVVYRAEWWDRAGGDDIARAYTTARAWHGIDPEADRAAQRIQDEVKARYGVDVATAKADPAAVRDYIARAETLRDQAGQERNTSAAELGEAQLLLAEADIADRIAEVAREAAEHEPDPQEREDALALAEHEDAHADGLAEDGRNMYDSAERRQDLATDLETKGVDREVVATRVRADVSQAKPAAEATKTKATRSPRARRGRKARGRGLQSGGLDR